MTGGFSSDGEAVSVMAEAADDLADVLQKDLLLPLGLDITAVTSTSRAVGDRFVRRLRRLGAKREEAPRRLWVRFNLRAATC